MRLATSKAVRLSVDAALEKRTSVSALQDPKSFRGVSARWAFCKARSQNCRDFSPMPVPISKYPVSLPLKVGLWVLALARYRHC